MGGTRLIIHDSIQGGLLDTEGIVEFTAFYEFEGSRGKHHERSRFIRVDGLWTYVDGIVT
nr:YchJ family metal-binding protein [Corynebacterium ulcerans]